MALQKNLLTLPYHYEFEVRDTSEQLVNIIIHDTEILNLGDMAIASSGRVRHLYERLRHGLPRVVN